MQQWNPRAEWRDADAYIIGGGPSLRGFDWTRLHDKHTIGCNSAFLLGGRVCRMCFFSDPIWYEKYLPELAHYTGRVVTHCEEIRPPSWIRQVPRRDEGLHTNALGFGGNSGCGAVNLALALGAKRVFLLGFDCKLVNEQTHWHDRAYEKTDPQVYQKFIEGWMAVARDLPKVYPGCQIINLTPGSALEVFPRAELDQYIP